MAFKIPPAHIPDFKMVVSLPLRRYAREIASTEVGRFAQDQMIAFKSKIMGQRFASFLAKPLKPSTVAKKRRYGRDPRVMISTSEYVGSIRVSTKALKGGMQWRIGHSWNKLARDTKTGLARPGVPMWKVALWNEKGTHDGHIPPRPHWGPHLRAMKKLAPSVRARIRLLVTARLRRSMAS